MLKAHKGRHYVTLLNIHLTVCYAGDTTASTEMKLAPQDSLLI